MNTKHTPGPWRLEKHPEWSQYYGNIVGSYGIGAGNIENIRTISVQLKHGTDEETVNCSFQSVGRQNWKRVEQSTKGDEMSDTLSSGHEEAKTLYNAAKRVIENADAHEAAWNREGRVYDTKAHGLACQLNTHAGEMLRQAVQDVDDLMD